MKNTNNSHDAYVALLDAIKTAGGQAALANICKEINPKVKQGHVSHWKNRNKNGIPAQYVLHVAKVLGKDPAKLKPEIFGTFEKSANE